MPKRECTYERAAPPVAVTYSPALARIEGGVVLVLAVSAIVLSRPSAITLAFLALGALGGSLLLLYSFLRSGARD